MRASVVLIAALAVAGPVANASAARPCPLPRGYEVATRTSHAVIAQRFRNNSRHEYKGRTYLGCLNGVNRWRVLHRGEWNGHSGHDPDRAALGGRYAAVSVTTTDESGANTTTIEVVNLRTGHHRSPLFAAHVAPGMGVSYVAKLRVSRYATLAWVHVTSDPTYPERSRWHLTAHNAQGTRVLQNGAAHTFHRIRFRGSRLEWLHRGQAFSAELGRR